ncbi:MAG: hypothetical protein AAF333_16960 [Planctomycetota bacterium]
MNTPPSTPTPLRDLVADQLNRHWLAWAEHHPHLARAIDRTRLIHSAVENLRDDPEFRAAMSRADLDEHRLAEAARVLALAERWVGRVLPGLPR